MLGRLAGGAVFSLTAQDGNAAAPDGFVLRLSGTDGTLSITPRDSGRYPGRRGGESCCGTTAEPASSSPHPANTHRRIYPRCPPPTSRRSIERSAAPSARAAPARFPHRGAPSRDIGRHRAGFGFGPSARRSALRRGLPQRCDDVECPVACADARGRHPQQLVRGCAYGVPMSVAEKKPAVDLILRKYWFRGWCRRRLKRPNADCQHCVERWSAHELCRGCARVLE